MSSPYFYFHTGGHILVPDPKAEGKYELEVPETMTEWAKRFSKKQSGEIFSSKKIAEIFNNNRISGIRDYPGEYDKQIDTIKYSILKRCQKRYILIKAKDGTYTFEYVDFDVWKKRFTQRKSGEVFHLREIIYTLNSQPSSVFKFEDSYDRNRVAIASNLEEAAQKHNNRWIQFLKYLIIPWIVAKIFGWTCLMSYEMPKKSLYSTTT